MKFENVNVTVVKVLPIQSGVGQTSGKEWKKGEFVFRTIDREYEKDGETKQVYNDVKATLWGSKCDEFMQYVVEGNVLAISGEILANEWSGKYFNEVKVTNAILVSGTTATYGDPLQEEVAASIPTPTECTNTMDDDSGLPF